MELLNNKSLLLTRGNEQMQTIEENINSTGGYGVDMAERIARAAIKTATERHPLGTGEFTQALANVIAANLRMIERRADAIDSITIGNVTIDKTRHRLTVGGVSKRITLLELRLLWALATYRDRCIDRDELRRTVWAGIQIGTRTIDAHMVCLRKLRQIYLKFCGTQYFPILTKCDNPEYF